MSNSSSRRPHRPRRHSAQSGMSLPELMIVLATLSIVANIAIPVAKDAIKRAHASSIAEDFVTFRGALMDYYQSSSTFPAERATGVVPPELSAALKNRVDFAAPAPGARLDYEYWINRRGNPSQAQTGVAVGLSVVTNDQALIQAIQRVYPGCFVRTARGRYTFVIEPVSGRNPC